MNFLLKFILVLVLLLLQIDSGIAQEVQLQHAQIRPTDKASLQRGVKLFMNYCSGCHSLQYVRYERIASDLGISPQLMKQNLIFADAKMGDRIAVALTKQDAQNWFGVVPPDLTLIAKIHGVDWLYTFLHGFYQDERRPWGANNSLFPDVAMPHVLVSLQGIQVKSAKGQLKLKTPGLLTAREYDQVINDIVNFLHYTAAPEQLHRQYLGLWVLLFLTIFAILMYLLKQHYWKTIKN